MANPVNQSHQRRFRFHLPPATQPILLASLFITGIIVGLRTVGALQGLELDAYDQMVRVQPAAVPDPRILIVGIDETDIQIRQEYPIADQTLADLLAKLGAAQPRAIGLDILRDVPLGTGRSELLRALAANPNTFVICTMSTSKGPGVPPPEGVAAEQVVFSDLIVDAGGILRRSLLIATPPQDAPRLTEHMCNQPDQQLVSLGLQLALTYLAAENIGLDQTEAGDLRVGTVVLKRLASDVGGYRNLDASGYQILLNYRSATDAAQVVSLSDVLSGQVSPDQIRDRIVLIGYTSPQVSDNFYTPYSTNRSDDQQMTGVMVHAQAISQILSAVLDRRPLIWVWSAMAEVSWIFGWSLAGGIFAWYCRHPLQFGIAALFLGGSLYGICFVLFTQGGWVPLVPAGMTLIGTAIGVVLIDRFNRSSYGRAVYRQVKHLLKIEIDTTQVERQVAEITETDYFNALQARAQVLRQQKTDPNRHPDSPKSSRPADQEVDGQATSPTEPETRADLDDFLANLKRKIPQPPQPKTLNSDEQPDEDSEETPSESNLD